MSVSFDLSAESPDLDYLDSKNVQHRDEGVFASLEGLKRKILTMDCIPDNVQRWTIIGVIATTVILSLAGILSQGYFIAAIGAVCLLSINALVASLAIFCLNRSKPEKENEYKMRLDQLTPFALTVAIPFVEEVIFRLTLQSGCQLMLEQFVASSAITILGFSFSTAALGSILISSLVFGACHYSNKHENSDIQAIIASIMGIFLGAMFYQFGFFASLLAHTVNNTLVFSLGNCQKIS
jgi:membrane protease YdiL (CAAX protease family)